MSQLLNSTAVSCLSGAEAKEVLDAYLATAPVMALNHTVEASVQPKGTGAGDNLIVG